MRGDESIPQGGETGSPVTETNIEFDGRQLVVRTDVPLVEAFVADTFRYMTVPEVTSGAGSFAVLGIDGAYRIQSADDRVIAGDEFEYLLSLVKEEVRFQFMRSRPDLLWIHAAAVERDGVAVLLCGRSGQGKSTLAAAMCDRGWRMMSDDVAPVAPDLNLVLPYPQSPVRRVPRDRKLEPHRRKGLVRQGVALPPEGFHRAPAVIGRMVFLEFAKGEEARCRRLSPGETALEILRNSMNLVDQRDMGVNRAAVLARGLLGDSLTYGRPDDAASLLDTSP